MNVEDYLARISYIGSREPNLANLKAIFQAHKISLPFSNLRLHGADDDNRIQLDLGKMYDHVVMKKGSGICYELNALFVWALQELGYDAYYSHSGFYVPDQGLSRLDLHMNPIVNLKGSMYYADAGFYQFGVVEIKHMLVAVSPFNVFRFREVQNEKGEKIFLCERHLKTVLDAEGNYLKKGPSLTGFEDCRKTLECQKEDSSHWINVLYFYTTPKQLNDFAEVWNIQQTDPKSDLRKRLTFNRFDLKPVPVRHNVFGETYERKESIDPIIDRIAVTRKLRTNEDIEKLVKEFFRFNITHKVKYFNEN